MKHKIESPVSFCLPLLAIAFGLMMMQACTLPPTEALDAEFKAKFDATPTSGNAPLDVTITNRSVGANAYSWSFGDNTPVSTEENPGTHRYTGVGTFVLQLIVTGAGGIKDTATVNILVSTTGAVPVAEFDISGGGCDAPCTVNFTNSSSQALSFVWDFGDGTATSTQFNPTHQYEICGDFIVTMVAINGVNTDTLRKPVSVLCTTFETFHATLGSGVSTVQNPSGGYTAVGSVQVSGNSQIYTCKYSKEGVASPPFYYGGTNDDYGTDILVSTGGTTFVLGVSTNTSSLRLEGYFTTEGNGMSPTSITSSNKDIWLNAVVEMSDGGFMIAGSSSDPSSGASNIVLVRTNSSRVVQSGFPKELVLPNNEEATDLVLLPNGNLAVIGTARETTNNEEILFVVVTPNGDIVVPAKYFGGNDSDYGKGIVLSEDQQSLYLLGTTASIGQGQNDIYLTKTDLSGNVVGNFPKSFGTSGNESAGGIDRTADGGFVIVGAKAGLIYLIKVDADGLTTSPGFSKTFGEASLPDGGSSVQTTSDGGFILCGQKDFNPPSFVGKLYLIKTDQNGNL